MFLSGIGRGSKNYGGISTTANARNQTYPSWELICYLYKVQQGVSVPETQRTSA